MLTGWPGPASLVEATWNSCSWHKSLSVSLYVKLSPLTPYVGEREHDDWGREGGTYFERAGISLQVSDGDSVVDGHTFIHTSRPHPLQPIQEGSNSQVIGRGRSAWE